jgi:uncharacterized protein YggE
MNEERTLHIDPPKHVVQAVVVALIALALFAGASALKAVREFYYVGAGVTATNTISVSGQGEVFAVPDIATFSITVHEEGTDVATAQTQATKKNNDILAYLRAQGIEDKDIKTENYSVNPRYEWQQAETCRAGYCPPGKQVLLGYDVDQTLTVKVRDTKKAGDILTGVGGLGASQVSGLSFTIDDDDALQAEARAKAIAEAQQKAEALAKDLGVTLVRIVGFNEDSGQPYYYAKREVMTMAMDSAAGATPAPEIPTGENKITSNVQVTYEIR